jgi:hypothetical protein
MMTFVLVAVAVGIGVLLAAMENPGAQESRSTERFSAALIAVGLAATAARVAQEVLS